MIIDKIITNNKSKTKLIISTEIKIFIRFTGNNKKKIIEKAVKSFIENPTTSSISTQSPTKVLSENPNSTPASASTSSINNNNNNRPDQHIPPKGQEESKNDVDSKKFQQDCNKGTLCDSVQEQYKKVIEQKQKENATDNEKTPVVTQAETSDSTEKTAQKDSFNDKKNELGQTEELEKAIIANNPEFNTLIVQGNLSVEDMVDLGFPSSMITSYQATLTALVNNDHYVQNKPVEEEKSSVNNKLEKPTESSTSAQKEQNFPTMSPEMQAELIDKAAATAGRNQSSTNLNCLSGELHERDSEVETKKKQALKDEYLLNKYLEKLPEEHKIIAAHWYLNLIELERKGVKNINVYLLYLEKRGLLVWEDATEGKGFGNAKLTPKFFELYKELTLPVREPLIDNLLENSTFSAVILSCDKASEFLDGLQNHVAIMVTTADGHRYITGYLTSQKSGNSKLSDTQELINNKNKAQYVHYFEVVKRITKDSEIQEILDKETTYINQPKHIDILKDILQQDLPEMVENYSDIQGINMEKMNKIIRLFDEQQKEKVDKEIKKYVTELKQNRIKYLGNEEGFNNWKQKYDEGKSVELGIQWPPADFKES